MPARGKWVQISLRLQPPNQKAMRVTWNYAKNFMQNLATSSLEQLSANSLHPFCEETEIKFLSLDKF
jgi:hypothetical protein